MEYLTSVVTGIVTKLGESLVSPIANQFGYLVYYNKNIKNLKNELKTLEGRKQGVQGMVDEDKRNGRQIVSVVENWLYKVENIKSEVEEFGGFQVKNSKCFGRCSPYLMSRYSLSKRAKRLTMDVTNLNEEKFYVISYPTPPLRLGSTFSNVIKSFPSRKSIMTEVMKTLEDEDVKRIGLCGMGGVGKTTFVKEIITIPVVGKLFDEIAMVVVSQNLDYRKIQGQIADALGLKLDKETIQGRACQLHERLKNINNVLIVLDDVWTELDFESIGIPSNDHHKNCKILFTSRIEDVCFMMRSQKNFIISILSPNESWDLFYEMAGSSLLDKPDIHHIAKEVANECGGLPIVIVTMAKALANKEKHTWEDALDQFKKSSITPLLEMQACVYSSIKLSYNFLDSEEDKIFLFLCCLFPEDFDIPIEVLLRHGIGLGLFKGIDALWKVRNRVHTIIDRLKRRFMLLDSNVEECVKMHDVVRDVIISIASREEYGFMVQSDVSQMEQPKEETWSHSTAISLVLEETKKHTKMLHCPKLKLLQVASKKRELVPENFFQGLNKLMVLSLQYMHIHAMSSTLKALDNIHTLRLEDCHLRDISIIGKELKKLEILSLAHSDIKQLPEEIGQLRLLRLLDLTECNYLIQISANVLASLSRLEELYLRVKNLPSKETNHILFELQILSHHLKVVEIVIMENEDLPKDLVFKNLVRFWVYVGASTTLFQGIVRKGYLHPNILKLNNAYFNYVKKSVTVRQLLQKVEILNLVDIKNLKNVILELSERGLPVLKHLSIEFCNNLEYVVDSYDGCIFPQVQSFSLLHLDNLKEIVNMPSHISQATKFVKVDAITLCQCFGSLTNLKIEYCNKLKTVFTLYPRTISFATLQCLHVAESYGIECIISSNAEYNGNSMTEFSNLVELKLQELPNLIEFVKSSIALQEHHSSTIHIHGSSVDELLPNSTLFKSNWMQLFPKLEKLFLQACSLLEMVFDMQESQFQGESQAFLFSQLKEIEISWLSKLRHIWCTAPSYIQGFQNLKSIKVKKCDSLRHVLTPNIAKALTQLQKLVIHSCQSLEKIVGKEVNLDDDIEEKNVETLVFGQLESLTLIDLPSLMSICPDSYEIVWPSLRFLCTDGCPQLKTSALCTPTVARQEDFNASSSYSTCNVVAHSTSKKVSARLLQCCIGCIPHACSNLKSKASSTEKGVPSVNNKYTKAKIVSPMPILEQMQVKGWDSVEVLFLLEQNQHSDDTSVNCIVKLIVAQVYISPVEVTAFTNLTLLSLDSCHKLRYLFPYSIAKLLVKLQEIKMSNCKLVKQLVEREGEDSLTLSLPQSNSLKAHENSSSSDHAILSQEARSLEWPWPSLKRISINHCGLLEVVVIGKAEEKIDTTSSFAQLQSLILSNLPNVVSFCLTPCASEPPSFENCHGSGYQNHEGTSNEYRGIMRLDPLIKGFIFPNLTYLAITGCNKISCLFSPSTSTSFVRLLELDIYGCRDIEKIVSAEETQRNVKIVFHSLKRLKLENLPKLKAFCQGCYEFDFPSLHEVLLKNCQMMETFSCGTSYTPKLDTVTIEIGNINKNIWMGDLNATVPLCKGLLAFQTTETLEWIKQDKCTQRYFTEEKHMTVEGFQRLLNLVPSNGMHIFQNLKQLAIKNCGELVEVFETHGVDVKKVQAMIHYKLEAMNLYSLPKLIHIWKNYGGVLGFQKLRILKVEHCGNLCSLFSLSIATSLVQLWHLRVHNCHMMEEITTKEDEATEGSDKVMIIFPLLKKLELRYVPNLKIFCSGTFNIDLPSLEEMIIEKCPNMTTFCYGSITTSKLLHIYKGSYEYVDIMGDLNMTIYHANESSKVALQTSDTITYIEHGPHLKSDTELVVEGSEKLLNCIPSNMLHRFQHLKQLKVRDCSSLVEIFESEGMDKNGDEGYSKTPYDYDLQEMHLYDLPKLMHIWKNHGGILCFMNLKKLKIQHCHSLKSVLSPSMAKSLTQLQELSVHECEMIEEIITREEEKIISEESSKVKITLPTLQWLTLYRLPSLRCFCSSTYHFELPSCHDITITECPKMEACHGTIGTLELPSVSMKTNDSRAKERS